MRKYKKVFRYETNLKEIQVQKQIILFYKNKIKIKHDKENTNYEKMN